MTVGKLSLSLYVAALMVQPVHAEMAAGSEVKPPLQIAPPVQKSPIDYKSTADEPYPIDSRDPRLGANAGKESEVSEKLKDYDMVVVIDKATQKLIAYKNGAQRPNVIRQVALQATVSTGQETRDCHFTKQTDAAGNTRITEVKPIYKNTPTGYFVPTAIDDDYYSHSYDAANMKFAVRIFPNEGVFNHVYPTGTFKQLGSPASHGCVRMDVTDAQDLFTMVMMTGPQFNIATDDEFHAHCPQPTDSKVKCTPSSKRDADLQAYFNRIKDGNYPYSDTVVKVRLADGTVTGKHVIHDLKSNMPRYSPYSYNDSPEVVLPNRDGSIPKDAQGVRRTGKSRDELNAQGQPTGRKIKFYNTLYIIKDSRNGTPNELQAPPPITCPTVAEANANYEAGRPLKGDVSVENAQGVQVQNSGGDLGTAFRNFFNGGGLFNFNQPQAQPRRTGNR